MIILPAIDLKNNKCVRLIQGDAKRETVYSDNPVDMANTFKQAGAEWIHVVDLDGAFSGKRSHTKIITEIIKSTKLNIEIGGGIRSLNDIDTYLNAGAKRVILGTAAHNQPELLKNAVETFGSDKIAVGIDCKNGLIAIHGWTKTTNVNLIDFTKKIVDTGVKTIIYTDIACDGMLSGPDYNTIANLLQHFNINIIASGGIASIEHIKKLIEIKPRAPYGCITGKAIYSGSLNLNDAINLSKLNS